MWALWWEFSYAYENNSPWEIYADLGGFMEDVDIKMPFSSMEALMCELPNILLGLEEMKASRNNYKRISEWTG